MTDQGIVEKTLFSLVSFSVRTEMCEFLFDYLMFDLAQSEFARESFQTLELILSHSNNSCACPVINWSLSYWSPFLDDSFSSIFWWHLGGRAYTSTRKSARVRLMYIQLALTWCSVESILADSFYFPSFIYGSTASWRNFSITDVWTLLFISNESVCWNDHFGLVILWWIYCSNCEALCLLLCVTLILI